MTQYWKTAIAGVTAGLIALQSALTDGGVSTQEWIAIALAALGAVGVWAKSNAAAPIPPFPTLPGKHERKDK